MDTQQALLQAILDNPVDDVARLVYADWLQENGDEERAEFIRVQVEFERMPDCGHKNPWPGAVSDCPHCTLRRREGVLLGNKRAIPWRALGYGQAPRRAMRRGFISEMECSLETFMHHAESLFRAHPIERVTLTDCAVLTQHISGGMRMPGWSNSMPAPLYDRLADHPLSQIIVGDPGWFVAFDDDEAALAAMSDTCVAYGRLLAGLT